MAKDKSISYDPRPTGVIEADRQLRRIRFSPCGEYLIAAGYDGSLRRWDLSAEKAVALPPLNDHRGWVEAIEFQPRGKLMFSVDSWGGLAARTFDGPSAHVAWRQNSAHDGWIRSLGVSDDGKQLATCGRDRVVRVWDSATGKLLKELAGHQQDVFAVAISPDGRFVASADLLANLKLWDVSSGACVKEARLEKMHYYQRLQDVAGLRILRFLDSGATLLCAGSEPTKAGRAFGVPAIRLLDAKSLKEKHTIRLGPDKNGYVFDLALHPTGYFMLVTSGPPGAGNVVFIKPDQEKPFYQHSKLFNPHSLAFHAATGQLAVAATNKRSQGNGAVSDKDGNYLGNSSPVHLFMIVS